MRDPFAAALIALQGERQDLFVLDADCSHSTRSYRFGERFPDRFLNVGIAEQNMVGMAAGLALAGFVPVICSFAALLVSRAAEQILQSVAYPAIGVKVAGHYAGVSASREGAPHHSIADLAFMRATPNLTIWSPADDGDVAPLLARAVAAPGPAYLRLSRNPAVALAGDRSSEDGTCRIWEGGEDVLLVAAGAVTAEAVAAARELRSRGIGCTVVAPLCLKPLPAGTLRGLTGRARLVVTVEEHSILGGLGGAVAEVLAEQPGPPLLRCGIPDVFTETGSYEELLDAYRLTAPHLVAAVAERLAGAGRHRSTVAAAG